MKLTKIETSHLKNMDLANYDIIHHIIDRLFNDLNKQLEDYIIEGLKRKGFEFKSKIELEVFIKEL